MEMVVSERGKFRANLSNKVQAHVKAQYLVPRLHANNILAVEPQQGPLGLDQVFHLAQRQTARVSTRLSTIKRVVLE